MWLFFLVRLRKITEIFRISDHLTEVQNKYGNPDHVFVYL